MKHPTSRSQSEIELHRVLDEIADLISSGSQVDVESYVAAMPEHAEQVRDFVASMQLLADFGDADSMSKPESPRVFEDVVPTSRVLGDFRVLGELGRGGMGIVYEAEQISLERMVALKILPFAAILDDRQLQRFKNEARAAATLHHPHIVPVFSVGSERGVHYYAMQKIEGATLAELLADVQNEARLEAQEAKSAQMQTPTAVEQLPEQLIDQNPKKPSSSSKETRRQLMAGLSTKRSQSPNDYFRTIAHWGRESAEALAYAHENGVLHRDIKPGNLMIDGAGHVWITDFGLARIETDASMTMSGDIVGTLRYMAPEQILGNSALIDHRADVYALGVTLYELATRHAAFSGADRNELIHKITTKELVSPRKIDASIPADLETIILKAASKAPEDRYTTAQELADDLQEFLADRPIKAKPPTVVERARKWTKRHPAVLWSAAVMLLVISLFSLSGFTWTRHKNSQLAEAVLRAEQKTTEANQALGRETLALSNAQSANETTRQALRSASDAELEAQQSLYLSTMRQAFADLQRGESERFAESMVKFIPGHDERDLRKWEWHYLLSLYQQHERVLLEHVNGVHDIDWHPKGRYLATAGVAGSVCLWDAADWSLTSVLRLQGVNAIDWHPNGKLLAIAHQDNTIRVWDTETGLFVHEIPTGRSPCYVLEFSPDGAQLAAAVRKQGCIVWDTDNFKEQWSHEMVDARGVSWSPEGQWLACSGKVSDKVNDDDHAVVLLDGASGNVKGRIDAVTGSTPVRWSPQGDRIAAGSYHRQIQIFDASSFALLHSIAVEFIMTRIEWNHDGQYLAAGIGKNVEIFDDQLRNVETLKGHIGSVLSIAWSNDGHSLVSGGTDGGTLVWQLEPATNRVGAKVVCSDLTKTDKAEHFFSRSGRFIATLDSENNEVVVRRVSDGTIVRRFDVELDEVVGRAAWSGNDSQLACITDGNNTVLLLNVASGTRGSCITFGDGEIRSIDWNPASPQLAVSVMDAGGSRGRVELWDTDDNESRSTLVSEDTVVNDVIWDASGTQLAVVVGDTQRDTVLRIWNVRAKEPLQTLTGHNRFHGKPAWSPDSRRIAAFSWDGDVTVWNLELGTLEIKLHGHSNEVQGIWHPSEDRIFTRSKDKTVRLWDVDSGEEVLRIEADCQSLLFPPNAASLYLAGKTLEVLEVRDERDGTSEQLLAYAARVKANQGELAEAEELLGLLPIRSAERNYLLRRLLNQQYWLAIGTHAAIDRSSPDRLAKMLMWWEEIVDERGPQHRGKEFGKTSDGYSTTVLLQCADIAAHVASQFQQDPDKLLAVVNRITRTVEQRLTKLSLSVKEKENILKIIGAVQNAAQRRAG